MGVAIVIGCGFQPTATQLEKIKAGGFIPEDCDKIAVTSTDQNKLNQDEAYPFLFAYYIANNLGSPPGVGGRELTMPDGSHIWIVNALE